jgi:cell division protein FtsL
MVIKFLKKMKLKGCNPLERQFIRTFKSGMCLFIGTGLIVSGVFFYIWPRASLVTLIYDYNKLQQKEKKITRYNKMLRLELASIKSLEKVERIAMEKMGMIVPEDKNIILVKAIK